ncbi:hypothetical protein NW762_005527 [Fusarium torreyae]|uniref:Secreted protein n=1 Tax=Fusarium torreyae TaxID=1237075 RepID=A0A9W8S4A2_9HYPO|nr:hypothetical protein NW762_005527 [Fusarium torreyae]
MLSKISFLSLLLPIAVSAGSCQLSANNQTQPVNQTQPFDPGLPTNQTEATNGTVLPPDDTPWVPTCKLPTGNAAWSVGFGFTTDCVAGTGTIQGHMIFVDFSDAQASDDESPEDLREFFVPSAVEWFKKASYGKLELNITADVSKYHRMPHSAESYKWDEGFDNQQHYAYVEDALSAYTDDVGKLPPPTTDILYVVPARGNVWMTRSLGSGFSAWTRDNIYVAKKAITFGNDPYNSWGYKALNHETGHSMCLPDYYPGSDLPIGEFTGGWDIMGNVGGNAPDFFAWDKWRLGWLTDDAIDCVLRQGTTQHTLTPLEVEGGVKAVVIAANKTSAVVAEARTAKGVDDQLCAPGVLLYTIDTTISTSEGPIRVMDATPGSDGCGNTGWEPLNDATLSSSGVQSYEVPGWGVKVTLVDDKSEKLKIQVEYS